MKTIKFTNGWSFEPATLDDIPGMIEIENCYFNESIAFTEPQLRAWIEYNPNMFYVVKKGEQVEAFTAVAPITEECYANLKTGIKKDMSQFKPEDFSQDRKLTYCYFADIATRTAKNKGTEDYSPIASCITFIGIVSILLENSKFVATTPVTDDGCKAASQFGFSIDGEFPVKPEYKPKKEENCFVQVDKIRERAEKILKIFRAQLGKKSISIVEQQPGNQVRQRAS